MIEVIRDLDARIILKQLRVGPLHSAVCQEACGGFPGAAQAFEQENGGRKFLAHASRNVLPGGQRHFVPGVATKSIHPPPAPGEKHFGEIVPEFDMLVSKFDQVLPRRAPRARADECAPTIAEEPFGMIFLQGGSPTGVVDYQIDKNPGSFRVCRISELTKLIEAGRAPIQFNQGRVDSEEVLNGIRTPETAEPRKCRRGGIDREQMENATPERIDDVREFANEVAELSRGRNNCVASIIEFLELFFQFFVLSISGEFLRAKHSNERAVNGIRCAIIVGMNGDADIWSFRPVLVTLGIDRVGLRLKIAHFGQRKSKLIVAVLQAHRNIMPGCASER